MMVKQSPSESRCDCVCWGCRVEIHVTLQKLMSLWGNADHHFKDRPMEALPIFSISGQVEAT
jgi:hypothetical protein